MRRRATTVMAQCCPTRKAVDGVQCHQHAARTLTVEQAAGPAPSRCPHCRQASGWFGDGDLRRCAYCGQWWERRIAVVGR